MILKSIVLIEFKINLSMYFFIDLKELRELGCDYDILF